MFTQNFFTDFDYFIQLITDRHPFAFSRYNDGEARVLKNEDVGNKDGWFYKKDRDLAFRAALRQGLLVNHPDFLYGLPSEQSDRENHAYFLERITTSLGCVTHGNLFSLANSPKFYQGMLPALHQAGQKIVLIANEKIDQEKTKEKLGDFTFFPLKGCCVKMWNEGRDHLRGRIDLHLSEPGPFTFLVCAGPLAKIIIHETWLAAPQHTYIDIGSALDQTFFKKSWRADHREPAKYGSLAPQWKLASS